MTKPKVDLEDVSLNQISMIFTDFIRELDSVVETKTKNHFCALLGIPASYIRDRMLGLEDAP